MQCSWWETLKAVGNSSAASYVNVVNYLQSMPFPYYWSLYSKLGWQVLQPPCGNKIRSPDSRSHGDTYTAPLIVRHTTATLSLNTLVDMQQCHKSLKCSVCSESTEISGFRLLKFRLCLYVTS